MSWNSKWFLNLRLSYQTLYASLLSSIHATCHAPLTLIIHEANQYVITSSLFLPRSTYAQIFPSAPFLSAPSAYILSSVWPVKFHTNSNQNEKLYCSVY
jgi:hypothetical protein